MLSTLVAAAVLVANAAAAPPRHPPRGVSRLWSQFPLDQGQGDGSMQGARHRRVAKPHGGSAAATSTGGNAAKKSTRGNAAKKSPGANGAGKATPRRSRFLWLGAAVGALALLLVGSVAVRFGALSVVKSRTGGSRLSRFNRHKKDESTQPEPELHAASPDRLTPASSAGSQVDAQPKNSSFVGPGATAGRGAVVEPSAKATPAGPPEAEIKGRLDAATIGEHVASVLKAAEAAAANLRVEAEQDSKRVREQAQREADEIRARVGREAESERQEAQHALETAGKVAKATRSEADRYAEERRREADSQVRRLVQDAERQAAEIGDVGAERHRVLLADIAASESRMSELAESLRDVAARLEGVVGANRGGNGVAPSIGDSLQASVAQRIQDQSAGPRSA